MIIPGNGNTDINENWFPYVKNALEKLGIKVIAENMPDPDLARKKFWVPFIESKVGNDKSCILIGHSSGAVAILRYAETHKIKIAIIVGASYTHLNDKKEKLSGYFDKEWKWNKIKENCNCIIQFASTDDPYIPIDEARYISQKLNTKYHEYNDQGHFGNDVKKTEFPEIVAEIRKKIKTPNKTFKR